MVVALPFSIRKVVGIEVGLLNISYIIALHVIVSSPILVLRTNIWVHIVDNHELVGPRIIFVFS